MPDGEKQESTVEKIFRLVVEGWTLDQIADVLNKELESSEKPRWSTDVVARLRRWDHSGDVEDFASSTVVKMVHSENKAGRMSRGRRAALVLVSSMISRSHVHESAFGSAATTGKFPTACGDHKGGRRGSMVGVLSSVPLRIMAGGRCLAWGVLDPFAGTGDGQAKSRLVVGAPMSRSGVHCNTGVSVQLVFSREGPVVPDLGRRVRDRGPPSGAENHS